MRKHFLLWTLLLICTMPTLAHDFTVDGIFYNKLSDSTVAVTYQGDSPGSYSNEYAGDIVIPESVLYRNTTYTITEIGDNAFSSCTALTSVVTPNSVTVLNAYAFNGCSKLTSVTLSDNLLSIERNGFSDYSSLTSISLPNGLLSVNMAAFQNCGLTNISLPNTLVSIGRYAFRYCDNLQYTTYDNAKYLGNTENPHYALIETLSTDITTCTIHEQTKIIAGYAFRNCEALTSIAVPDKVLSICNGAFNSCSKLIDITLPNTLLTLEDYVFYSCTSLSTISLPDSLTSIGKYAFSGCTKLRSIVIPDKIQTIKEYTFNECSNLRPVTLPKNLATIEGCAFYHCSALPAITIPSCVDSIGILAFNNCSGLTSITVDAKNPPALGGAYVFSGVPTNTVLTVPCEAVSAYKAVAGWADFTIDSYFDYTFNAVSSNIEHGTVAITQEPTCENGCEAIIEATANQGYQFSAWNDGNTENPRIVTITEDMTYTATFEAVKVESITLNHTEATVNKGETLQLEANILPLNAQNKNVIWASDNSAVASVSDGVITAQEKGTATIKAITADGGKLATCQVTVIAGITSFTLDETEVTLAPKTNTVLTPIFTPEDADIPAVTWASEDTNIAIVSNGRVVALSVGQTIVTATTVDGAFTASCLVKVETPVTSITINPASLTLNPGDAEQLTATVLPEDATNKNYTWSSDNENVAMMIDGGWVVALESGIAYITATTENGYKTATCRVIVGEVPDSITNEIVIIPGETTADFSWPAIEDALSYIFVIYADAAKTEKICTLTFDEHGYLVRIDFLRKPSATRETQRGFNFLVTGLDRATTYGYTLDSYSDTNTVLDRKVGQFTTLGNVATQVETSFMASPDKVSKVLENGTIYIIRNGEKYTIDGRKVSIM